MESQEEFIKREFPRLESEFKVDIHNVGKNRFRINYWERIEREGSVFYGNKISRSYYLTLTKNKNSWKHEILI